MALDILQNLDHKDCLQASIPLDFDLKIDSGILGLADMIADTNTYLLTNQDRGNNGYSVRGYIHPMIKPLPTKKIDLSKIKTSCGMVKTYDICCSGDLKTFTFEVNE